MNWVDKHQSSQAKIGLMHLKVYRNEDHWEAHTTGGYWRRELKAASLEDAKTEAAFIVREELFKILEELDTALGRYEVVQTEEIPVAELAEIWKRTAPRINED